MKFTFLYLLIILSLASCSTFQNPQPYDGVRIERIPDEWLGDYTCGKDSCLMRMQISPDVVVYTSDDHVSEPIAQYFTSQGKHFVKQPNVHYATDTGYRAKDSTEIFFPTWTNDSLKGISIDVFTLVLGNDLILRRCGPIYVANVRQRDREAKKKINTPLWCPIVIIPNGQILDFYFIDEKKLENLKRNEQGVITQDLSSSGIFDLVRKKRKSLISLGFQLNLSTKKLQIIPEK